MDRLTRRMRTLLNVCLILIYLFGATAIGADDVKLKWLLLDFPPISVKEGADAGEGFGDKVLAALQAVFGGYQVNQVFGTATRLESEMRRGGVSCSPVLLRTPERQRYTVFSRPYTRMLPTGIITLRKWTDRFEAFREQDGTINLHRVLAEPSLRLGLPQSRIYGKGIDDELLMVSRSVVGAHVQQIASENQGQSVYGMLARERIHYTLGYAIEARYQSLHHPLFPDTVFLPVRESNHLLEASISCPDTSWGRLMVDKVNVQLQSAELVSQLKFAYEKWLQPESIQLLRRMEANEPLAPLQHK